MRRLRCSEPGFRNYRQSSQLTLGFRGHMGIGLTRTKSATAGESERDLERMCFNHRKVTPCAVQRLATSQGEAAPGWIGVGANLARGVLDTFTTHDQIFFPIAAVLIPL